MRAGGILSKGIEVPRARASLANGPITVFSSLNRDALRAARHDDRPLAREIVAEANRVERNVLAAWVRSTQAWMSVRAAEDRSEIVAPADALRDDDASFRSWTRETLRSLTAEAPELLAGLMQAATDSTEVRARFRAQLPPSETTLCRVWRIGPDITELRLVDRDAVGSIEVGTDRVLAAGFRLGDPVAMREEPFGRRGMLVFLDPAVETEITASRSLRSLPGHLTELLAESAVPKRSSVPEPLRRVA
ncbi:MAG TPA: hypothetical protein VLK58_22710 [Conexibacter sp.]|nr:hypothetical protein [Conexibacter sp.]